MYNTCELFQIKYLYLQENPHVIYVLVPITVVLSIANICKTPVKIVQELQILDRMRLAILVHICLLIL